MLESRRPSSVKSKLLASLETFILTLVAVLNVAVDGNLTMLGAWAKYIRVFDKYQKGGKALEQIRSVEFQPNQH